jgi:hypothetical protein
MPMLVEHCCKNRVLSDVPAWVRLLVNLDAVPGLNPTLCCPF